MGIYILPRNNNFLSLSGGTVSGETFFNNSLSAVTYFSGSTPLEQIIYYISSLNSGRTYSFSAGSNILLLTSSTNPNVIYSLDDDILLNSISASTLYSGTTNLSDLFLFKSDKTFLQNGINTFTGGTVTNPSVNITALTINTLIASGNSVFTGTLSGGSAFSAHTIYSGSTDVSLLFATPGQVLDSQTFVQPGTNTYTGGTPTNPTINVSALTINTLIASGNSIFTGALSGGSSFSANTIFSGTSNLNILFSHTGHTHNISDINNLQNVLNTKLNISGGTMTGGLLAPSISATTLSGGTIYSGSTDVSLLFATPGQVLDSQTFVQPGTNTYTGGTPTRPTVNVSALTINTLNVSGSSTLNTLSANTLSAQTFYSGTTFLDSIFITNPIYTLPFGNKITDGKIGSLLKFKTIYGSGDTIVTQNSDALYITTTFPTTYNIFKRGLGQYSIIPIVGANYSQEQYSSVLGGKINYSKSKYSAILNGKQNSISSQSEYGFIGNGFLNIIIQSYFSNVLNGSNNKINSNGYLSSFKTILNGYNNKIYGNSKYSSILGGNNNYIIKANYSTIINGINRTVSQDYTTLVEKIRIANLSYGDSKYMLASDNSGYVFKTSMPVLFVGNGTNTYTGGTSAVPTINISALTINTLVASGNSTFTGTLSGGSSFSANTLFSGTSNLDTLFVTPGQLINAQTFVQPGVNTYTGGTPTRPTVNVSALTINTLNVSGNSIFTGTLSGGSSFSANTLFSGTTNLYDIFSTTGSISSSNVWTAGTGSNSIKQANALSVASGTYSLSFGKNSYAQASYSIALSHSSNIFNTSRHSIILGGVYLSTNQYTSYNTLVGGKSNSTTFSTYNFIGGGISNSIDGYAKNYDSIRSVIVGGFSNKIYRSIDSGIFAGNKNTIGIKSVTARNGNTIVGGINNTVISQRSSILAGYSNRITSYNSVILGGYSNNIKSVYGNIETKSNSILGGEKNFISYSNRSVIVGGFRNSALTVSDSCIIGGSYLTVTQNNTVVVPKLRIASITNSPGNYMLVSNTNGYTFKTSIPVLSINNGINTYTGGTTTNPTINISALTINTLNASGSSVFTGTLSGGSSFSANTLFSGTTNLNDLFHAKSGYLLQKNGLVSGSTFAGSPLTASVNFTSSFFNNNYVIVITGEDARMWSIQSKTVNGFIINSNSSVAIAGNVFWMASENGEGYK